MCLYYMQYFRERELLHFSCLDFVLLMRSEYRETGGCGVDVDVENVEIFK